MFDFFNQSSKAYAKRAHALLTEARFAQLEHEAAAEHHHALAQMYADRVRRLQAPTLDPQRRSEQPGTELVGPEAQRASVHVLTPPGAQTAVG